MNAISSSRYKLAALICIFSGASVVALGAEDVSVTDAIIPASHFDFSLMTSLRAMQGNFDPYGQYQAFPAGTTAWSWMTMIGTDYRISRFWEVGVTLPIRHSVMDFPSGSMSSQSLSAPFFDVKYHIGGWPHLTAHIGGGPSWQWRSSSVTGNPQASMPDDVSDSINGVPILHAGIGASRFFNAFRVAVDANYSVPFSTTQTPIGAPAGSPPVTVQEGNRIMTSQGVAYMLNRTWSFNGSVHEAWSQGNSYNGVAADGTNGRSFSSSLGVIYSQNESLRWMASYETQYPFYSYAANQAYSPAFSLGLNYVGF